MRDGRRRSQAGDGIDAMLARLFELGDAPEPHGAGRERDGGRRRLRRRPGLPARRPRARLRDPGRLRRRRRRRLARAQAARAGGARAQQDLRQRLEVLPQSYLQRAQGHRGLKLATTLARGNQALVDARGPESTSLWPEAHYLAPLHPILDWAADRALASLGRNEVFAVGGEVDEAYLLLHGTLTNRRGQVVSSTFVVVHVPRRRPTRRSPLPQPLATPARGASSAMQASPGRRPTPASLKDVTGLDAYVAPGGAAPRARSLDGAFEAVAAGVTRPGGALERARRPAGSSDADAAGPAARDHAPARPGRGGAAPGRTMLPDQRPVRPLLVVVPTPARPEGSPDGPATRSSSARTGSASTTSPPTPPRSPSRPGCSRAARSGTPPRTQGNPRDPLHRGPRRPAQPARHPRRHDRRARA